MSVGHRAEKRPATHNRLEGTYAVSPQLKSGTSMDGYFGVKDAPSISPSSQMIRLATPRVLRTRSQIVAQELRIVAFWLEDKPLGLLASSSQGLPSLVAKPVTQDNS